MKGYQKTPEQVKWFTELTRHKPVIFQNGTGKHNLWSYITDEMPEWKTWHYEGFLDKDLTGYLKNGCEIPQVVTMADCLWNVKGYDSAASIRNAVAMFYGKDMFRHHRSGDQGHDQVRRVSLHGDSARRGRGGG